MKILQVLTYYRPWVSGLTMYVEWLSKALVQQGHEVTVLTSQYQRDLPQYDVIHGVKIVRVPVAFRLSKGVIMPGFGPMAWKLARQSDLIHVHLPQFDAPGVALRGRLLGKPVVLTYHCDLRLPPGLLNRLIDRTVLMMNRIAGTLADAVVTYTHDYAKHSPFLSPYLNNKIQIIPPPVELQTCTSSDIEKFRADFQLDGRKVIGMSARLATEKGVEVLLEALPLILKRHPNAIVLHAGMHKDVIGEGTYAARLAPMFEKHSSSYHLLGNLNGSRYAAFHASLDCLVICSLNSTESFGLVQIEAMLNGKPVAASNLPGVRQPVLMTGMGELAEPGDHVELAQAVIKLLDETEPSGLARSEIAACFSPTTVAEEYTRLFDRLMAGQKTGVGQEPSAYLRLRESVSLHQDLN